jgi:hypothetical protein
MIDVEPVSGCMMLHFCDTTSHELTVNLDNRWPSVHGERWYHCSLTGRHREQDAAAQVEAMNSPAT